MCPHCNIVASRSAAIAARISASAELGAATIAQCLCAGCAHCRKCPRIGRRKLGVDRNEFDSIGRSRCTHRRQRRLVADFRHHQNCDAAGRRHRLMQEVPNVWHRYRRQHGDAGDVAPAGEARSESGGHSDRSLKMTSRSAQAVSAAFTADRGARHRHDHVRIGGDDLG